jgi:hypothetical protein
VIIDFVTTAFFGGQKFLVRVRFANESLHKYEIREVEKLPTSRWLNPWYTLTSITRIRSCSCHDRLPGEVCVPRDNNLVQQHCRDIEKNARLDNQTLQCVWHLCELQFTKSVVAECRRLRRHLCRRLHHRRLHHHHRHHRPPRHHH